MRTLTLDSATVRPSPEQALQGLSMRSPSPAQLGQVCFIEKKPWERTTWPWP
jgi:hypothetical protein